MVRYRTLPRGVKKTRTPLRHNQVPQQKIGESISFHCNQIKMLEQIAHLHSTLSLWDQGYLAGLCDARISINQI